MKKQIKRLVVAVAAAVMLSAGFAAEVPDNDKWTIVRAGATTTYDTLSDALAELKDGDTLAPLVAGDKATFSRDNLNPVSVDCPLLITNNDVTIDLKDRALTKSIASEFVKMDATKISGAHLLSFKGAMNVTVKNGFLYGTTYRPDWTLTDDDKRALYVGFGSDVTVTNCAVYAAALIGMVSVYGDSKLTIVDSWLDGQGDGSENTIRVRDDSTLVLKNVKGRLNPNNFWNSQTVHDTLPAITGEQFVLEDGTLELDNTSISNTITHWSNGYLAKPVVVRGENNKLVTKNGAQIVAIGKDGAKAPLISMKSPTVEYPETRLSAANAWTANEEIVAASMLARVEYQAGVPNGWYRVVTDAEQIKTDLGIEKITVEVPSNCTDGAVCSCITVKATDGSLLLDLYGHTPEHEFEDGRWVLPSNALAAAVLNNDLQWAKKLNDNLREFSPEIADILSSFSNVVNGVTCGIYIATVPDAKAADGLGRIISAGVKGVEVWNQLTNDLARVGDLEDLKDDTVPEAIGVCLKPSSRLGVLLGGDEPHLTFVTDVITKKYFIVGYSSKSVRDELVATSVVGGKHLHDDPTFIRCAGKLLDSSDHGFHYVSPDFLKTAGEGACRRIGIDPGLVAELGAFWMFSTTVVDADAKTVKFLTRMPKGANGTAEAAGRLALRFFENLHPELAGLVTFAEGYAPSAEAKERLVQISDALLFLRDKLGVEGLDFSAERPQFGVAKTDVRFLAERGGALARLLANGRSGYGVAERYLPATAAAAWGFQPDAEKAIEILDTILTRLGATEAAETVRAFQYRGENFASDAAFAITMGDAMHAHEDGVTHKGINLLAVQRILNKNLWTSIQIALQRAGATVEVKETGVVICHLPVSDEVKALLPYVDPAFCFVPEDNVILFSTSHETGTSAMASGRDGTNRLVEDETFLTQMGGEFPAHQTFRYVAPKADADLILSLGEVLKQFVPESLIKALLSFDVSAVWSTGVGNMVLLDAIIPGNTIYVHKGRTSSSLYEEGKRVLDAAIDALAASVSIAYPYDYTRARRFYSQLVTLNVDSVDEHGKCRVRMLRRPTIEGAQDITVDGEITMPEDKTKVTQHTITYQNLTVKFILSSEGVFGFESTDDECNSHSFILRESMARPDFGDRGKGLTPAEIDEAVSNLWADLGIKDIVVRAPVADTPEGVVRTKVEVNTTEGSSLRKFFDLEPDLDTFIGNIAKYLPANCLMATVCNGDLAWATNATAAIGEEFPDVAALLSVFGELAEGISGGIATAIVPDSEAKIGLGCKLLAGVKGIETWHALTNRLMRFNDIVRVDCINDFGDADVYLNPKGVLAKLMGGRQPVLSFGSCQYYEEDWGKYQIAYHSSTNVYMDEAMYVYPEDRADQQLLVSNETFKACAGPLLERAERGFKYVSPDFIPAVGKAALGLLGLPEEILDLEEFWDFSIVETNANRISVVSRMPQRAQEKLEAIGRLGVNFVGKLFPTIKGTVKFDEEYEPSAAAQEHIADLVGTLKSVRETLGVTGLDYRYQPETAELRAQMGLPETGDEFYGTLLSVGTEDENSAFLRLVAAGEPGNNIAENYLPDSAVSVWAFQPDMATWIRAVSKVFARIGLEDISDLLATTFPERFDGHSCAIAITSDESDLRKVEGGTLTYGAPGILVAARAGTDASFRTLEWILKDKGWDYENTDDLMVLRREGEEDGIRLCYSVPEGMLIVATSQKVLDATLAAGLKRSHRLCDGKDFLRVMGSGFPHNTLRYQDDRMLGRLAKQVANIFADVVPEGIVTQILGADILNTAESGFGVKKGDTFFRYGRSPKSSFEMALPLARAAFKTLAEAVQTVYPYDGTKPRVFDSVFYRHDIDVADADGLAVERRRWQTGLMAASGWTFMELDRMEDESQIESVRGLHQKYDWFYAFTDLSMFTCIGDAETGGLSMAFEREDEPEPGIAIHVEGDDDNGVITLTPNAPVEIPVTVMPATATLTAKKLPGGISLKKVTLDKKAKTYSWVLKGKATKVGNYNTVFTATLGKNRKTVEPFYSFKVDNYRSDAIRLLDAYDFTAGVAVSTNLGADTVGCSVSGLPSGLKFDKKTGLVSGTPKKPGDFLVTFTKRVGKATEKATATFAVAGRDAIAVSVDFGIGEEGVVGSRGRTEELSNSIAGLGLQPRAISVYAGVKVSYPISTLGLDGVATTVSAKGLPGGLKLVKTAVYVNPAAKRKVVDHYEYAIEGVPTVVSKVDKKSGAVKPATVVVSATNKYKWTGSRTFTMTVLALPGWAVGTFNGVMTGADVTNAYGKFTGTVGATGKISLKLTYTSALTGKGATATFSVTGFERYNEQTGEFVIRGSVKTGAVTRELNGIVLEDPETGLGRMQLVDDDAADPGIFDGVQNGWKLKGTDLPAFPTGKAALTCDVTNETDSLTLKFGAKGSVTFSGKVTGDNGSLVSVSGSTCVLPLAWVSTMTPNLLAQVCVYVAPKKNLAGGLCEVFDVLLTVGEDGKFDGVLQARIVEKVNDAVLIEVPTGAQGFFRIVVRDASIRIKPGAIVTVK